MRPFFSFWIASLLLFATSSFGFDVPALTGPIVDKAGMISQAAEAQLGNAILELQQQGGAQIAVLTVPSLRKSTIEQASIAVTDKWKLGTQERDNGVLVLLAKKERQVRIEVGQGLEGSLTDAYAKRIVDEVMVPLFRSGSIDQGVLLGVAQIAKVTSPNLDVTGIFGDTSNRWKQSRRRPGLTSLFPLFLFFLLFIGLARGRQRGSGLGYLLAGMFLGSLGGGRGGFSSGGSGGFGGGFSGGGGGFSGGGASGSW